MSDYANGSPRVSPIQKLAGWLFLALAGWKIVGEAPTPPKYVAVFAPHTSNWDFPLMLSVVLVLGVRIHWFGKQELFQGPFKGLFVWLGGIPIDRGTSQNTVKQVATIIATNDQMVIGLSPEGTRSYREYWKSGFYHIAQQAKVPVALAYLDYERKVGGFGPVFDLNGDIEKDINQIREFYGSVTAKFPHKVGPVALKPMLEE